MNQQKIKETIDKLPGYSYRTEFEGSAGQFICHFFVNNVLIATGKGTNKVFAKHEAAKFAYNQLIETEYEFAKFQGQEMLNEDYHIMLKNYCEQYKIQMDIKKGEKENGYKVFLIVCGEFEQASMGFNDEQTFNYGCYKMLQKLQSQPMEMKMEPKKPPQQIKIIIKKMSTKIEEEVLPPPAPRLTINDFWNNLGATEEIYDYFIHFIQNLGEQVQFRTVGSYNLRSMRILKPQIDILIMVTQSQLDFEKFLEQFGMVHKIKIVKVKEKKHFRLEFPEKPNNQWLKWVPQNFVAHLYLKKKIGIQQHDEYMQSFQLAFEKYRYAIQSLQFVRQWKDEFLPELPTKILDYLIVQVTNEFQNIINPLQVLQQVIFLLQQNVLENILHYKSDGEEELNPFLQKLPQYQVRLIKKVQERQEIVNKASQWNKEKIDQWVLTYCN